MQIDLYPLHDFAYQSGDAYHFQFGERCYVLYEGTGPGNKREVLVFDSNEHGRVRDWLPVAGGSDRQREDVLDELRRKRGKRG